MYLSVVWKRQRFNQHVKKHCIFCLFVVESCPQCHLTAFTVIIIKHSYLQWAHLTIMLPINCWTPQIQTLHEEKQEPTTTTTTNTSLQLLLVLLQNGPSTWYKGILAYVVMCLKPAIQYMVYKQFKNIILTNCCNKQQQYHHHCQKEQ